MTERRHVRSRSLRRGTVAVLVTISLTMLVGFMALAIDVGMLYNTKAELQRAADAAALAAAVELGRGGENPMDRARAVAQDYVNRNTVLGQSTVLTASDFTFGQAYIDDTTGKYVFNARENAVNAVRLTVRRTEGSPSGPVPLFFARIFGFQTSNLSATAGAAVTPRDIVFAMDVSGSHNDDSSLRSFRKTTVPIRRVWEHLWDPAQGVPPLDAGEPAGPYLGNMTSWGTSVIDPSWDFANDIGLARIPKGSSSNLSAAWVSQTLSASGYGAYTAAEMSVINNPPSSESTTAYRRRVRVALGLDRWRSGKSGGQAGGNGDNNIDSSEISPIVPYPSSAIEAAATTSRVVGGSWDSFVDYVSGSGSSMCQYNPDRYEFGDPGLQYRYGMKTFTDYLQSNEWGDSRSPGLAGSPEQPMDAVTTAVKAALDIIAENQSNDLVGLAAYDKYGYGPADKPNNLSWLTDDLDSVRNKVSYLQAGMWYSTTNTAQGLDKSCEVLFNSSNERRNAIKVIFLLTDGRPNQTRANPTQYYEEWLDYAHSPPRQDTVAAATDAASGNKDTKGYNRKVQIFTVSVGANCDLNLMQQIAAIGKGSSFHAGNEIGGYQQQLKEILRNLGGKRPVALIE